MTRQPPADWVDPWPDGDVLSGAPRAARWVANLASALRDAIDAGTTLDDVARQTGISVRTVRRVLDGSAWPRFPAAMALARFVRKVG